MTIHNKQSMNQIDHWSEPAWLLACYGQFTKYVGANNSSSITWLQPKWYTDMTAVFQLFAFNRTIWREWFEDYSCECH